MTGPTSAELSDEMQELEDKLRLLPQDDPNRPFDLENLASMLCNRYKTTESLTDISDAIRLQEEALLLINISGADHILCLSRLASYLWTRERAQEAVQLTPEDDPYREDRLVSLAVFLFSRYEATGDVADLRRSTQLHLEYLQNSDEKRSDQLQRLYNPACCLLGLYNETECLSDLSQAVQLLQETVNLSPTDHPSRSDYLSSLASALQSRYHALNDVADLSQAIQLNEEATRQAHASVQVFPRSAQLCCLSSMLWDRYKVTGNTVDLDRALECDEEALRICPLNHPRRSLYLLHLSYGLREIAEQPLSHNIVLPNIILKNREEILTKAVELLRESASLLNSFVTDRLDAATQWYESVLEDDSSALEAATLVLNLLDSSIGQARSLEDQYKRLSSKQMVEKTKDIASGAAAIAIKEGNIQLAVSLLEQGRGIIFSHLGRYRATVDDLKGVAPELVEDFLKLSNQLNRILISTEREFMGLADGRMRDRGVVYHGLQNRWNQLVETIRKQDGCESFLWRPTFNKLQGAALDGPIILININFRRSDAIIIFLHTDPILVPLPDASPELISAIARRLGPRPAELHDADLVPVLQEVWYAIGQPITEGLHRNGFPKGRIWWCPTGEVSRIPLHAAGPFRAGERNLSQLFVHSYTPTLSALIRARQLRPSGPQTEKVATNILLVGQPNTPNEPVLPLVIREIEAVQKCMPGATTILSEAATCSAVLHGLSEHPWIHLACHGHHHPTQPFLSHFSMWDGPLSLLDLLERDLPSAELAVLSACHSARVSEALPDEILHPAAGMLFTGFKSVIGTMWALEDGLGSELSAEFYKEMLRDSRGPNDYTKAAAALGKALRSMARRRVSMTLAQRINVIHVGV